MVQNSIGKNGGQIKFVYIKPEKYEVCYVNGAYGGLTPRGDLLCNFFFESRRLPKEEVAEINDGKLLTTETDVPENEVLRELKFGVIMTTKEAKNLADWIYDKIEEYETSFK